MDWFCDFERHMALTLTQLTEVSIITMTLVLVISVFLRVANRVGSHATFTASWERCVRATASDENAT